MKWALEFGMEPTMRQKVRYWWPLLFEGLRLGGYGFGDPGEPEQFGTYTVNEYAGEIDPDSEDYWRAIQKHVGSFRQVWDTVQRDPHYLDVTLWTAAPRPVKVSASVESRADETAKLRVLLDIGTLLDLDSPLDVDWSDMLAAHKLVGEQQAHLLRAWFDCMARVYLLCEPGAATFSWPDSGPVPGVNEEDYDDFEWVVAAIGHPFAPRFPHQPAGPAPAMGPGAILT